MTRLYKYIPWGRANSNRRKWNLDIFQHQRLHLSAFDDLNDPMEAMFNADNLTNEQIKNIQKKKPNIVIGSFAKIYSDLLMWSYYGDNHKGFCLEFEINDPFDEDNLKQVNYTNSIEISKEENLLKQCVEILSKKLWPWKQEQEIRYLKLIESNDQSSQYVNIRITKVYFGIRMSSKTKSHFQKILSENVPHIEIQSLSIEDLTWWNGEENVRIMHIRCE